MTERITPPKDTTTATSSSANSRKQRRNANAGLIPTRNDRLLVTGELSLAALTRLGKELDLKHNTAKALETDLKGTRSADSKFHKARILRLHELTPRQNQAHKEAGKFIVNTKTMMTPVFGSDHGQDWEGVGFQDHSLATPAAMPARMALLERIVAYLTDHKQFENEPLHVTAEKGAALYARYTAARDAVQANKAEEKRLSQVRKDKRKALRKRLRSLQNELEEVLADNDPRWVDFGITPPAEVKEQRSKTRRANQLKRAASSTPVVSSTPAPVAATVPVSSEAPAVLNS